MIPLINILLLGILFTLFFFQRKLNLFSHQLNQFEEELNVQQIKIPSLAEPLQICIEINNPLEIAKKESKLAKAFSSISPNLIKKKVYLRFCDELKEILEKRGIESTITLLPKQEETF